MKLMLKHVAYLIAGVLLVSACEGPMGPAGADGLDGNDGKDANETCKLCHNNTVVAEKSIQFQLSKHNYGEAAFEEAGNTTCGPCHLSEAFKYVCKNNVPATFTLNQTTGKYSNSYASVATAAYGDLGCTTCHVNLHTNYAATEFLPLTTTAPVQMTMWKAAKTINLTQDNGFSNLCVKCHQPRPLTTSSTLSNGDVVDYASLVTSPTAVFYDNTVGNAAPNKLVPSYRMHVHYGTVGAVFAGQGGVEFPGSVEYESSEHTEAASCQDCHMATMSGAAGGHTFVAKGNFNGCNVSGCHSSVNSSSTTFWKTPRTEIQTLLNTLAARINAVGGGTDILHSETDSESNLWAGLTTGNYDGYLNIYDANSNPSGYWRHPAPSSSWSADARAYNNTLPVFPSLTNAQVGAMINFQFCLREYSLGIHNYKYSKALLQNSIEALNAGV